MRNKASQGLGHATEVINDIPDTLKSWNLIDIHIVIHESRLIEEETRNDSSVAPFHPSHEVIMRNTSAANHDKTTNEDCE